NFDSDDPAAALDLHWHVFENVRGDHADDRLWRAARPATFGEVATTRLNDTDHLVHTIEHASHEEPAHRIDWIVDVASLLPHVDEQRLLRVVRAMALRDVVAEGLEIAAS